MSSGPQPERPQPRTVRLRAVRGRRLRAWLGLLGTVCMVAGGFAYARMPRGGVVGRLDVLRDVRTWHSAQHAGVALCFLGVALLTVAWLLLGAAVRAGAVGVAGINRLAVLWAAPLLVAPPLFSGDAWSYAADGFLTGRGDSPYVFPPAVLHGQIVSAVCRCWRHTVAPYGPIPLLWGGGFSQFTSSPWLLMLTYRLLAVGGLGLLMHAVPRLARVADRRPAVASWLAVASPFVLADGVGGAHLDLLMAGLVCAALVLAITRGWVLGGLLVGVATAVKAPAVVAGLGLALLGARSDGVAGRVRAGAGVAGIVLGTVLGIGFASGLGVGWMQALRVALVLRTPLSLTFDGARVASRLLHVHAVRVFDATGVAVLVVGCVVLLLRARTRDPRAAVGAAATGMLLATVLSPVTNYWYYLWCVPLLACCVLPERARRCLLAFVGLLGAVTPLDPSLHVAHSWLIVTGSAAVTVLVALGWPELAQVARDRLRPVPVTSGARLRTPTWSPASAAGSRSRTSAGSRRPAPRGRRRRRRPRR